jgi:hypothetical protein
MILISLISEQTLPNVLVIKALKGVTRHIFLSTDKMERQGRSQWIRQAAKLKRVEVVSVPAEDYAGTLARLAQVDFAPDEAVSVNLTGGTKMMALAAFTFFTEQMGDRCQVYYLSLQEGHLHRIFPTANTQPMAVSLSLDTYLTAHGVSAERRGTMDLLDRKQQAYAIMNHLTGQAPSAFLGDALQHDTEFPDLADHKFYAGEWFEVWAYHQCRHHFGLAPDQIQQGVHLTKSVGSQREFTLEYDLLFVKNNHLFLVECKYWPGKTGFTAKKANPDLRKLGHAKTQLGLYARTAFWTANAIPSIAQGDIAPYLDFLGIRAADIHRLGHPEALQTELDQW